ncbi:MAG: metallophosphoesterase [Nocardioides sp.]
MLLPRVLGLGAAAGLATLAYAAAEARAYTLREVEIPLLAPRSAPVRVLHVSDLHMTPGQRAKQAWVRDLSGLEPDLVVGTGDFLGHRDSVPVVLEALGDLLERPGVFVFGSNDYYEPTMRNPVRYLLPDDGRRATDTAELPWRDLRSAFGASGWLDLTNTFGRLDVAGRSFAFAGVDDPHLGFDDLRAVAGPAADDADVRLGVAHAPYLRVLDQFAGDGYDAVLAGHTHGGQVCVPFLGALTTNSDLDTARAKGVHRHPADSRPGDPDSTWMHVSAGLGTSPYVRLRVACRPEASLVTLTARPA